MAPLTPDPTRPGLEELRIRDLGAIREATVEFGAGLTAVTGETGAGKTMVVTGLQLLFGGRGDSNRVRSGAARALLEGRLRLPPGESLERAIAAGAEADEDGTLLVARSLGADGRSRAHLGGRGVPLGLLGELSADALAVHGQSDQLRLLRPAEQRAALDRYAGPDLAQHLVDYAVAYRSWREAERALADRTGRARELAEQAELLRHGLAVIEALDPQPSEDVQLRAEASRLQHADLLQTGARTAHEALAGDPGDDGLDAAGLIGAAQRALTAAAEHDPRLTDLAARLAEAGYLLADVAADLASYEARAESDPARLEAVNERLAALQAVQRRYGESVDDVLAWADSAGRRLLDMDTSEQALLALTERRDAGAVAAATAAAALSTNRRATADGLSGAVAAELAGLAMPQATVRAAVRPRPALAGQPVLSVDGVECGAGPDGTDDVEFLLAAHADAPLLPLGRGASGGELSRLMLALEVVLAGADPVPLLVFDEVDAGVGGRAAVEVGRRLARLAVHHQVVVVTHLAQVAAFADTHLVVEGTGAQGGAVVRRLPDPDRPAELARMLAGQDRSVHGRLHAQELLAAAAQDKAGW